MLATDIGSLQRRYSAVEVTANMVQKARAAGAFFERRILGGSLMYFEEVPATQLTLLGSVRTPTIAELSIALLGRRS